MVAWTPFGAERWADHYRQGTKRGQALLDAFHASYPIELTRGWSTARDLAALRLPSRARSMCVQLGPRAGTAGWPLTPQLVAVAHWSTWPDYALCVREDGRMRLYRADWAEAV